MFIPLHVSAPQVQYQESWSITVVNVDGDYTTYCHSRWKQFYKTKPLHFRVNKWNFMWNLILKNRDNEYFNKLLTILKFYIFIKQVIFFYLLNMLHYIKCNITC
jgi:hypothetical protein